MQRVKRIKVICKVSACLLFTILIVCYGMFVSGKTKVIAMAETTQDGLVIMGDMLISYNGNAEKVVIPNGVTKILSGVFKENDSLKEIFIPDSVTTISDRAFSDCVNLTKVTLPDNITAIGNSVFYNCYSLTEINIPDSVTSIGDYAFYRCDSLTEVNIPDSVTSIGDNAFSLCNSLVKIDISNNVTSIGNYAFSGCILLEEINLPNNLSSISDYLFFGCFNLNDIDIPKNVTSIGKEAFNSCTGITKIIIPSSVLSIGDNAFNGCWSLKEAIISKDVTTIGDKVFYWCSKLKTIKIPNSVTSIGEDAFEDISWDACFYVERNSYAEHYISELGYDYYYYTAESTDTSDKVQDGLIIENGVVVGYTGNAKKVVIPEGVTYIGDYAFVDCNSLTEISLPNSVTAIGKSAFMSCVNLNKINIPEGVTYIGSSAFYGCNRLTEVTLPNSVTYIDWGAFSKCSNLTKINIPSGVTSINDETFSECKKLEEVNIPNTVTAIGECAFYGCESLSEIIIPNSVKSIGYFSFGYCNSLIEINIPDSVTSIGELAFSNCFSLVDITIPNSVISIGNSAFSWCENLKEISIPNSVTSMGEGIFWGCSSLNKVTLSFGVTSISKDTFRLCESLRTIIIPKGVTSIGDDTFYGCENLTGIYIPKTVTSIGLDAFYDISSNVLFYVEKDSFAEQYVSEFGYNYQYYVAEDNNKEDDILAYGVSINPYWIGTGKYLGNESCFVNETAGLVIELSGLKSSNEFTVEIYDADGELLTILTPNDFTIESLSGALVVEYYAKIHTNYTFTEPGTHKYIIKYVTSEERVAYKGTPPLHVYRQDVASKEQLTRLKSFEGFSLSEFIKLNPRVVLISSNLQVGDYKYEQYRYIDEDSYGYKFYVNASDKTLVTDNTVLQKLWYLEETKAVLGNSKQQLKDIQEQMQVTTDAIAAYHGGGVLSGLVGSAGSAYLTGGKSLKASLASVAKQELTVDLLLEAIVTSKYIDFYNFNKELLKNIEEEERNSGSTVLSNYEETILYMQQFNDLKLNYDDTRQLMVELSGIPQTGSGVKNFIKLYADYFGKAMSSLTFGLTDKLVAGAKKLVTTTETVSGMYSSISSAYSILTSEDITIENAADISKAVMQSVVLINGGDAVKGVQLNLNKTTDWLKTGTKVLDVICWVDQINNVEVQFIDYHRIDNGYIDYTNFVYDIVKNAAEDRNIRDEQQEQALIEEFLFNAEYYAKANEDVAIAMAYDEEKLYNHWLKYGKAEGRNASLVFNAKYYLEKNPSVAELVGNDYEAAYKHFVSIGLINGLESSPVFSVKYYLEANADVAAAFGMDYISATRHFSQNAIAENRSGSGNFDYTVYTYCNTDVATLYGKDVIGYYIHYINHGRAEGRTAGFKPDNGKKPIDTNAPSYRIFDAKYYMSQYPALGHIAGYDPDDLYRYWIETGIDLGQSASPVLNPAEYLELNQDVAEAVGNDHTAAIYHFLVNGIYEGRTASKEFDYTVYIYCNKDVGEVFGDDIVGYYYHYVKYGRAEGRTARLNMK